jgi:hypothetical protein
MRLDANFKADLTGFKLHYHEETGTLTATLSTLFKLSRKQSKELLGQTFHALAFAGLSFDGEIPLHAYTSVKPTECWEKHSVKLAGHGPFPVMPEWGSVKPVKDEEAVLVELRLPLIIESKQVMGELACMFGESIDVHMKATQLELPLDGAAAGVVKAPKGPWGNAQPVAS